MLAYIPSALPCSGSAESTGVFVAPSRRPTPSALSMILTRILIRLRTEFSDLDSCAVVLMKTSVSITVGAGYPTTVNATLQANITQRWRKMALEPLNDAVPISPATGET